MTLQELERIRTIRADMERNDEAIERLQSQMERVTQIMSGLPRGGAGCDILADQLDKLHKLQVQREVMHVDLEIALIEAEIWIAKLPEQQRMVMRAYYIAGAKDWKAAAEMVPYSYVHTKRIKAAAFEKLEQDDTKCYART